MHSGEQFALATTATAMELEIIRARMRGTVALLDRVIAERRHLRAVPDTRATIEQISAGRPVLLLFQDLRHETERVGE